MKNPKFTPDQDRMLGIAERLSTRAQIYELGVAAYLKDLMPNGDLVEECRDVLADSVRLRKRSNEIHVQMYKTQVPKPRKPKTK